MSTHPEPATDHSNTDHPDIDRSAVRPVVVAFDTDRFDRLLAGDVSSDVAHLHDPADPPDLADLASVLDVLDPKGRDFGTDVADLVAFCLEHRVLRLLPPVTGLSVSPTVVGESRDGGFLVLVTVADAFTLVFGRTHTADFDQRGSDGARSVLAAVAATACAVYEGYLATSATLLSAAPGGDTGGSAQAAAR